MLWAHALLHYPRPGQLRAGDHHRHETAEVHVLLLPLLSTRAGGAGAPREHSGLHHAAVASPVPQIHSGE